MNAFGGITFGPGGGVLPAAELPGEVDLSQLSMDPAALDEIGIAPSASGEAMQVVVYLDFLCPFCAEFETTNGPALKTLRDQGKITLEYRPLGFLDQLSNGTKYSTRSAEAAACVANNAPTSYERFFDSLFKNQPAEMSAGLDNAVLVGLAQEAGAGDISSCLANRDFAAYVGDSSILAQNYGVSGTPTVFVEGQQWSQGPLPDFTAKALAAKK
ncbi:DsbA family protein [Arthrobacter psychrochitiniphilus]|uniref:DsbA family protein n=1 Tax=Arthrobacter psychrochitiniphilus TaxID=291045 RepID=UPI003F7BCB86